MLSTWGKRAQAIGAVGLLVLAVFGIFAIAGNDSHRRPDALPEEFLYLDSPRTDAYLSQLTYGLSASERRTLSNSTAVNVGITGQVAVIGANSDRKQVIDATVTPTAADRYYRFEQILKRQFKSHFHTFDMRTSPQALRRELGKTGRHGALAEGDFVELKYADLQLPSFVLPLSRVAYATQYRIAPHPPKGETDASTGLHLVPVAAGKHSLTAVAGRSPRAFDTYLEQLGRNPPIPFHLRVAVPFNSPRKGAKPRPPSQLKTHVFSAFIEAQYADLFDAPSLLGGSVTVVGKVVRLLPGHKQRYYDVQAGALYRRALKKLDSDRVETLLKVAGSDGPAAVKRAATITGPGFVVIPLAMYE